MGNKLLEELRRDLVDGKLRIMHNGIDIYIDCLETGDKLIIPMTSAKGMQPTLGWPDWNVTRDTVGGPQTRTTGRDPSRAS